MSPFTRAAWVAALTSASALGIAGCAPRLPPTVVPAVESPALESVRTALKAYIDQTQPFRKDAAGKAEAVPNQATATGSDDAVRLRQRTLADAIRLTVRPNAQPGDVLSVAAAAVIQQQLSAAFGGSKAQVIQDALQEQNEGRAAAPVAVAVNQVVSAPRVPPVLLEVLPQLPEQVEFAFSGRTLILRDVDAEVVVDFMLQAFPVLPAAGSVTPASSPAIAPGNEPFFALPGLAGSTSFALIGDSGSGDSAQQDVADAMLRYFTTARRFTFVLMLGDNLYHDDYVREFAEPYRGLLERGVLFYAALGNHDRVLQQHYKPFHMTDRLYFAFTQGNARFVVLNSNVPADRAQLAWFDGAFGNTGTKWRISFFHHPLYSSGEHARESRDSIRPALEPALLRNRVDVVFSGHDHLYERIAPQQGIRYFVSGGGGRNLYAIATSPFDAAGASAHHFMVVEISGDLMYFAAITPRGRTLDCGVFWRTADAEAKPQDTSLRAWQAGCRAATAWVAAGRDAGR